MPRVNMIPVSGSCAGSDLLIAAHAAFLAELQIKGCMDRSNRLVDGFLLESHIFQSSYFGFKLMYVMG